MMQSAKEKGKQTKKWSFETKDATIRCKAFGLEANGLSRPMESWWLLGGKMQKSRPCRQRTCSVNGKGIR
jgi:hypothetical protein